MEKNEVIWLLRKIRLQRHKSTYCYRAASDAITCHNHVALLRWPQVYNYRTLCDLSSPIGMNGALWYQGYQRNRWRYFWINSRKRRLHWERSLGLSGHFLQSIDRNQYIKESGTSPIRIGWDVVNHFQRLQRAKNVCSIMSLRNTHIIFDWR